MVDPIAYDDSYHWCPICGDPHEACTCGADDRDEPDDDPEHEIGCDFPGECLMPGEHMRCECHTVEMVEVYERELTGDK